jgi:hypothetical protein
METAFQILALAALVVITALFTLSKFRHPWEFLRDRAAEPERWWQLYGPDQHATVVSALEVVRDAFLLRKDDVFRLRPEDRLLALYRAANPPGECDALEFNFLEGMLAERFHVETPAMKNLEDPTVQDVVELCLKAQGTCGREHEPQSGA